MRSHITFYLRPSSKDPKMGTLYWMEISGSKVLRRKSLGHLIPVHYWLSTEQMVSSRYKDAYEVNELIGKERDLFNHLKSVKPLNTEDSCVLSFFHDQIEKKRDGQISFSSYMKYQTILNNFRDATLYITGTTHLPVKLLRDKYFTDALQKKLLSSNGKKSTKSNNALKNYLSVFGSAVKAWNIETRPAFPIDVNLIFSPLKRDVKKLAPTLTEDRIKELSNYTPSGRKNGKSQLLAKSVFLFQYFAGGLRIQDTVRLTNQDILEDAISVRIKKTRDVIEIPIHINLVDCLRPYYPKIYQSIHDSICLDQARVPLSDLTVLMRVHSNRPISKLRRSDLESLISQVEQSFIPEKELILQSLRAALDQINILITALFFKTLKNGQREFLFPYLNWREFHTSIKGRSLEASQYYLIQKIICKHNSALKRISQELDIPKMTGHTPRHSVARHLLNSGEDVTDISLVLGHAHLSTTEHYLQSRHSSGRRKLIVQKLQQGRVG